MLRLSRQSVQRQRKKEGAFTGRSFTSKAALEEAKAEAELGQMIACVLDPSSKVEKI